MRLIFQTANNKNTRENVDSMILPCMNDFAWTFLITTPPLAF